MTDGVNVNETREWIFSVLSQTALIAAVLISLLHYSVAQENPPSGSMSAAQSSDRSPYLGRPIMRPEELSGLWEAHDGHGGAVGIHLLLTTTISASADTLSGTQQSWQALEVGVYERKGVMIQLGEQNYFSDSPRGGNVSFEDAQLRLHFVSRWADLPSVDLDLVQAGDRWVGRFHRGNFDSDVTLRRPGMDRTTKANPIVGTWLENTKSIYSCVHIAQLTQTDFTGWSDSLQVLGSVRFAENVPRPTTTIERYGELMKVQFQDSDKVSFELYAFAPACCSHTFIGALMRGGTIVRGTWPPGANQSPYDGSWRKMAGTSCVAPDA